MIGSVQTRGKNKYLLTVSDGFDNKGKRIRKTKTISAKSKREAEEALYQFRLELQNKKPIEEVKTFKAFTEKWLSTHCLNRLAPKTYSRYTDMLEDRIYPFFENVILSEIKPIDILEFYDTLRKDGVRKDGKAGGLSEKTILHYHQLLSAIFECAVRWDEMISNPAYKAGRPKATNKKISYYDEEQVKELLRQLNSSALKYQAAIYLDVTSGLRRGELLGLEWCDINFKDKTVSVRQSSQYLPHKGIFLKDPKTESSIRTINIPCKVLEILSKYKLQQEEHKAILGEQWINNNRIFVQDDGRPMHPDSITQWFAKFIKSNSLPHITLHGLRHTNASLLLANGADSETVRNRLGHASLTTTFNNYIHPYRKKDEEAAETINEIFFGSDNDKK